MTTPSKPAVLFPGRYAPFHRGHQWMVETGALSKGLPACIAVRNTPLSAKDPYTVEERIKMIKAAYTEGEPVEVIEIPDICGLITGRKVGYFVEAMDVPAEIAGVSATQIREAMVVGNIDTALENVPEGTREVLKAIHAV